MTNVPEIERPATERLQRRIGRTAFGAIVAGLAMGLLLFLLSQPLRSARVFALTCGLLMVLPIVNVLAVLVDEIRRRDWVFVMVAAAILGLVAYSVIDRVYLSLS